ncbi:MAG: hypothetical protein EPO11_09925 [Gammaproteobacteria bacterium]|nr:MAG: hypothetical protein EPO11_09925 [Gammaproteobacteria bacterium]
MAIDKYNKKVQEETEGESGHGGHGGRVEYREFIGPARSRDEQKRLLSKHGDLNEANIKKGKETSENYKKQRENPKKGLIGAHHEQSLYKGHPILSKRFSGADPKVSSVPTEIKEIKDTEPQKKFELTHQPRLTHAPKQTHQLKPRGM